jgi:radical SAM enzyme (TIGR01210 family)
MDDAPSMDDDAIRALRPERPAVDPTRPHGALHEEERLASGGRESTLTVFLAGRECPFSCVYCDLWRYTTEEPTPEGAIPAQLEEALSGTRRASIQRIKLYNAANFFDPAAVPEADHARIAALLQSFPALTVESHPKLLGRRCRTFAERLPGRLEVAMGLETVHPRALPLLNKRMTLDDFERAAAFLGEHEIDLRAFVLVGTPFVPREEQVEWALRSVAYAARAGARHITLIPVRGGNGALEKLAQSGHYEAPPLAALEQALSLSLKQLITPTEQPRVVTADLWDLEKFATCSQCSAARRERLERINLSGVDEPLGRCDACGWGG